MDKKHHIEAAEAHFKLSEKDDVSDEKRTNLLLTAITHLLFAQVKD